MSTKNKGEHLFFSFFQLLSLIFLLKNPWCRFLPTLQEAHPPPTISQRRFTFTQGPRVRVDAALYFPKSLEENPHPHPISRLTLVLTSCLFLQGPRD